MSKNNQGFSGKIISAGETLGLLVKPAAEALMPDAMTSTK